MVVQIPRILRRIRERRPVIVGRGKILERLQSNIELMTSRRAIVPTIEEKIEKWELGKNIKKLTER